MNLSIECLPIFETSADNKKYKYEIIPIMTTARPFI
jgi:hypothetical protein